MAMLAGFFSILFTIESMRQGNPSQYHAWAAQLIMLSMILDGLDGNIARLLKGESEFGAELDTYVDLMSFGLAPALLIYAVSMPNSLVWRVTMTSAVVLSGMVRLARFKVKDPFRGQMGYAGLPITACAGWVALLTYISQAKPYNPALDLSKPGWMSGIFLAGIVLFISLQVSNVRYPKPTKNALLFIPCAILVVMFSTSGSMLGDSWGIRSALVLLLLGSAYCFFGPLFLKGKEIHLARKEARNANGKMP
jgi:CDP-diacylglycerol--serine O-phosphatidyltransferase